MKKENMSIKYRECADDWMLPFVEEVLSHIDLPERETLFVIDEIDDRAMRFHFETITGIDEDGDEIGEEYYAYLRYWIDKIWPKFCVSYCLYIEGEEKERGAYQVVHCCGQGECIPID